MDRNTRRSFSLGPWPRWAATTRRATGALTALLVVAVAFAVALSGGRTQAALADTPLEPPEALGDFASTVETLGEEQYSTSFAGAVVSDSGVNVYAIPGRDSGLVAAVDALNTAGYAVAYPPATRSYSQLEALNQRLARLAPRLQALGVRLAESSPDPSTGSVDVALLEPTAADLTRLGSSEAAALGARQATPASYPSAAAAAIRSLAGTGYTVESQFHSQAVAADRYNGVSPFAGGDYIRGPHICTGGFSMIGNASGNPFMLTAGHCGSGTWSTPAELMGQTSSSYWNNPGLDDFQTIRIRSGGGVVGKVNGDSAQYPVRGKVVPAVGAVITVDGSITGERNGIHVTANDATLYNIANSFPPPASYAVAHLVIANSFSTVICQGGDSGGPFFQRQPPGVNTYAMAVGTIVAIDDYGEECAAERIGYEEAHSNTSLLTD